MNPWPHPVAGQQSVLAAGASRPAEDARVTIPDGTVIAEADTPGGGTWHVDDLAERCGALAAAGAVLVTTGPFSPSWRGGQRLDSVALTSARQARHHRQATGAVHRHGARLLLRIQHAGSAATTPWRVGPSVGGQVPAAPSEGGVRRIIRAYGRAGSLAVEGGYDGVEVDATQAALPGQFLSPTLNHRADGWGGTEANRQRLLIEVVHAVRAATSGRLLVVVRLDPPGDGDRLAERGRLEGALLAAGADAIADARESGVLTVHRGGRLQPFGPWLQ